MFMLNPCKAEFIVCIENVFVMLYTFCKSEIHNPDYVRQGRTLCGKLNLGTTKKETKHQLRG
jgi:hypothetical protein